MERLSRVQLHSQRDVGHGQGDHEPTSLRSRRLWLRQVSKCSLRQDVVSTGTEVPTPTHAEKGILTDSPARVRASPGNGKVALVKKRAEHHPATCGALLTRPNKLGTVKR